MLDALFMSKVRKSPNGCWHWTGHIHKPTGYPYLTVRRKPYLAHRYAYEDAHGPVPRRGQPGHLQVDHECHNRSKSCPGGPACLHRRCVNPAHLVAKTAKQNSEASAHTAAHQNRRKTHCRHGHAFTPENTYRKKEGGRACKTCAIARAAASRRRRQLIK